MAAPCSFEEWSPRAAPTDSYLRGAAYGNNRLVIVGDEGALLTLEDGVRWQAQNVPPSVHFAGVDFCNGIFVVGGRRVTGSFDSSEAVLWTSGDGLSWTPRFTGTNTVVFGTAFGNGRFVAVSGGYSSGLSGNVSRALTSSDGVQWTQREIGPGWLYDVAFGNGVFVAVGGYRLATSADGLTWQTTAAPGGASLQSVVFTGSEFVVVGEAGFIATSVNGLSWTVRNSGVTTSLATVAVSGQVIAAAGNSGLILTSTNGVLWTPHANAAPELRGLVYGSDSFVAVGRYGTVLQSCSRPVTRLRIRVGSPAQIELHGIVGAAYRIEFTDQLNAGSNWQMMRQIPALPATPFAVQDALPSPTGRRFYRAVLLP